MESWQLALVFLLLIPTVMGAVALVNRWAPGLLQSEFPDRLARAERERVLAKKVDELEITVRVLSTELEQAHGKIAEQKNEIVGLKRELIELHKDLDALQKSTPKNHKRKTRRVLGVWPVAPQLNQEGEKSGIFDAGFDYIKLEGAAASRAGIVRELDRFRSDMDEITVEIGAKGGGAGIQLADGLTSPGWWLRLVRQHPIDTFVVLANESSKPDVLNVADALFNAGVRNVISVDAAISDADAVAFARRFYERLAVPGVTVAQAVESAKLLVTDGAAETIRLRER